MFAQALERLKYDAQNSFEISQKTVYEQSSHFYGDEFSSECYQIVRPQKNK